MTTPDYPHLTGRRCPDGALELVRDDGTVAAVVTVPQLAAWAAEEAYQQQAALELADANAFAAEYADIDPDYESWVMEETTR